MTTLKKNFLALLIALILIGPLTFSSITVSTNAAPDEVVVLTPHSSSIQKVADADFKAWYKAKTGRDVTVTWEYKDTTAALALVREAGGDPAKVKWDVWWGGGLDAFKAAKEKGLLAPFYLPNDPEWKAINANIPAKFGGLPLKDLTDYTWWGSALSGFGIMYNKAYLKTYNLPVPRDWINLTNSIYKGHIIWCPPSKSGSNHMIAEIILQYYGWNDGWTILKKFGRNVAEFVASSSHVPPYVGRGEYGIAPVIDFYGFGQAKVNPDVVFFYPPTDVAAKSTVINPDSVAILKGKGDNNPVAVEFMKFVLGADGQKMLFKDAILRMPVRTDVYEAAPQGYFNPFKTELTLMSYNETLGSIRYDILNDLFDLLVIAAKDDLEKAYTAYSSAADYISMQKAAGANTKDAEAKLAEAYAAFAAMPISEAEANSIAPTYSTKREAYKADWLTKIKSNYAKVVELSANAASLANPVLTLRSEVNAALATVNNYLMAVIALQVIGIVVICILILRRKS